MKYRDLGRTGLEVPPICLGAMNFGGPSDERDAQIVINLCRESGINFPDTANVYTGEKSEEIVGRGVHADRHRWVIATKVNAVTGDGPNERGSSRKSVMDAVDGSLARMRVDYIDVYNLPVEGRPIHSGDAA